MKKVKYKCDISIGVEGEESIDTNLTNEQIKNIIEKEFPQNLIDFIKDRT